jgi:hypothetical protein
MGFEGLFTQPTAIIDFFNNAAAIIILNKSSHWKIKHGAAHNKKKGSHYIYF